MSQTFNKFYLRTLDTLTDSVDFKEVTFKDIEYFLGLNNTEYYKTIVHNSDRIQIHTIIFKCDIMRGKELMCYTITYESSTIKD